MELSIDPIRKAGRILERSMVIYRTLGDLRVHEPTCETQRLFSDCSPEEVTPLIELASARTGLPSNEVAIIGGGVRLARRVGLNYDSFQTLLEGMIEEGRLDVFITDLENIKQNVQTTAS